MRDAGESTQEEIEGEDNLNDLGLLEHQGIMEERSIKQTDSIMLKPNVGSKKKRVPKSITTKLELAGNAASQSKNLRSGKGLAFSREP